MTLKKISIGILFLFAQYIALAQTKSTNSVISPARYKLIEAEFVLIPTTNIKYDSTSLDVDLNSVFGEKYLIAEKDFNCTKCIANNEFNSPLDLYKEEPCSLNDFQKGGYINVAINNFEDHPASWTFSFQLHLVFSYQNKTIEKWVNAPQKTVKLVYNKKVKLYDRQTLSYNFDKDFNFTKCESSFETLW